MIASKRSAGSIVPWLATLALLLLSIPSSAASPEFRVLFIGNSLTAWNDLPLVVEAMARARGLKFSVESVAYPNVSLEDHWGRGTQATILRGSFTDVVLQQGPSSLLESRENLREWAKRFGLEIRRAGARPALFMVWPDRTRLRFFEQVRESYALANEDVGGVFLPAGEAWQAAWRKAPNLPLYGPDDFHPSRLGTYLAAAVILRGLTSASAEGLPSRLPLRNGVDFRIDEGEARRAQEAVAEVMGKERR